tara:strand:+ start:363 stop:476 length:114 start_codon:yes stop_codon:yes gene_type:complete
MMEPFANVAEAITFLSFFIVAVVIIPYAFHLIGKYLD